MFSVFSNFTIIQWNIFGSIIVVIAISIALYVVMLLGGLDLYPTGISGDLDGHKWESQGPAVGCAVLSGICILMGIMALVGNLFRIRCLTLGGLITSLVLFLIEIGASVYLFAAKERSWFGYGWDNDMSNVIIEYYPTHAAAFNDKYGNACPSTYVQSAVPACSNAMSQYIKDQWHKMGLAGLILGAFATAICIFAIVMHCLVKRENRQQQEWKQAAEKYPGTFEDTKTPSSASTELENKV
jgi:hypothetical protein